MLKKKYIIEIIVFLCGAVVMIFEIVGSRVVAPFVGASIYVWTSLIGVILASLSLGYYVGGYMADKRPRSRDLAYIILFAAVATAFTALIKDIVSILISTSNFILEIKSVAISFVLFAPASFFLGMVSPYAVRLRMNDLSKSGSTAGNLYAISTCGSIFGTFLAGFYIIPNFGSTNTLIILSLALFLTALILLLGAPKGWKVITAAVFLIVFIGLTQATARAMQTLFVADVDTAYNRILIAKTLDPVTKRPILALSTGPHIIQAAVFTDGTDDLVFGYTKFYRLFSHFVPNPTRALMIGGSAYTYPRDFIKQYPNANIDVVEIDPGMTHVAQKYFGLHSEKNLTIYHEDARMYLNKNTKKYDIIFGDAFNSAAAIPFHLTTREVAERKYEALTDGGIVMLNMISAIEGDGGKFARAEYATYKDVFPQVYLFAVQNTQDGTEVQNIMLVALKSEKKIAQTSPDKNIESLLAHIWQKPIDDDVPILTDDFAPVEYYKRVSM